MLDPHYLIILGVVVAGMICLLLRALSWSEAHWAISTSLVLLVLGQVKPSQAFHAVLQGYDVYLFLGGMMLVAELARRTGVFDYVAVWALRQARGSSFRLFCLVYAIGVVVTVFLSNDATAVVLTPAVVAAVRAARLQFSLPHLYACALVANAASFVLPISNPANLVVFGDQLPALSQWLALFALPSLVAIVLTFYALLLHQRPALREVIHHVPEVQPLTPDGRRTVAVIAGFTLALVASSALGFALGLPSFIAGLLSLVLVYGTRYTAAKQAVIGVSWSVIPLVAGLFIMVQALQNAGVTARMSNAITLLQQAWPTVSLWLAGMAAALVSNVVNNLPAGLFAGAVMDQTHASPAMQAAVLVGIDLGPNLSMSGSLATLLWLAALRREGMNVTAWQFLKMGMVTLPIPLALTLGVIVAQGFI